MIEEYGLQGAPALLEDKGAIRATIRATIYEIKELPDRWLIKLKVTKKFDSTKFEEQKKTIEQIHLGDALLFLQGD